jgi:hypothetical protein
VIDATVFDWLYNAGRWTWHDPDGYNFISGPLADITLLGGGYVFVRRHNCHAKRCWRVGRHAVDGTTYVVCRKHHPDPTPSAEDILAAHDRHWKTLREARASVAGAVKDAQEVAHDVAADVHEVAQDVHAAEEQLFADDRRPDKPPETPPTANG